MISLNIVAKMISIQMKIALDNTILKDSSTEKKLVFLSFLLEMLSCKKR